MFQNTRKKSLLSSIVTICELIYHTTVRDVRSTHGNAFMALFVNISTAIIFVLAFYFMFTVLGLRGAKLRGDFMLYMMSGVFLYLTHIKSLGAVAGAAGPSSPMMQHAPMNTVISITSAALGALYIQVLSALVILFVYHTAFQRIEIDDPIGALGMLLLAWFTGCGVGLLIMAAKPWFPTAVNLVQVVYTRANMIASGKLFVANTLPGYMLAMFDWNPLFHAIDQCRGYVFANYFPHNTNAQYALIVGCVLLVLGLLAEFYTRQFASSSWYARR
ncbi:Polysialic acid transport protein KpsM [Roseovarius sp. THAF27]|uniref:ABC transporter permease n=1 Tax=unclassified Roseovarius TaxID=2614913 RepID=UPI001267B287|nr:MULTISPECIES: ABC transporter permease [unclassified Roseovarius]QFT83042.1 Polysialic acid transport protein KpsM [Roseovarius sp. THAF27]QFT97927.1 Polysialic acid transport protein KpsM [Roseovarius sp. THAF8]